jgi:hypothetical protein
VLIVAPVTPTQIRFAQVLIPSLYAPIRPQLVWIETCSKASIRCLL